MHATEPPSETPAFWEGVDPDGAVRVAAQTIPFSSIASRNALAAFLARLNPPPEGADVETLRAHYGRFNDALAEEMAAKYAVDVCDAIMGGVPVQRVSPRGAARSSRLLINLHGGGFMWGAGSGALVEAIPVAAIANTTVITVDYRMAPEHMFPAASQDVCAVYQAALRNHPAHAIGIYGCSAGAILTAQTIAWLQAYDLPLPGACAMLCGAGSEFSGDSIHLAGPLMGTGEARGSPSLFGLAYMRDARRDDPLALPACSDALLAIFPPTLLVTATRDFAASSVTQFHRRLAASGVDTDLFVFDGLWHAFHIFCDLPESEETYRIIARFFDRKLAPDTGGQ